MPSCEPPPPVVKSTPPAKARKSKDGYLAWVWMAAEPLFAWTFAKVGELLHRMPDYGSAIGRNTGELTALCLTGGFAVSALRQEGTGSRVCGWLALFYVLLRFSIPPYRF